MYFTYFLMANISLFETNFCSFISNKSFLTKFSLCLVHVNGHFIEKEMTSRNEKLNKSQFLCYFSYYFDGLYKIHSLALFMYSIVFYVCTHIANKCNSTTRNIVCSFYFFFICIIFLFFYFWFTNLKFNSTSHQKSNLVQIVESSLVIRRIVDLLL